MLCSTLPHSGGQVGRLSSFAERPTDGRSLYAEQAYARLRRIKHAVDPRDLIRSNHPIPAAR